MQRFELNSQEAKDIESVVWSHARSFSDVNSDDYHEHALINAHELPRRLRARLNRFRLEEPSSGILIVSGFPIDNLAIGPTPSSLEDCGLSTTTRREEAFLVLVMSLLGDTICWSTQQSGRMIHDVFPIKQHQDMQLGTGCKELLTWHTEDAFHDVRSDYVGMLCLRNPQRVATTIASMSEITLDEELKTQLFREEYCILPDESHRGITDLTTQADAPTRNTIQQMLSHPQKVAVLFGDREKPFIRIDPYFMPLPESPALRNAYQRLVVEIDNRIKDVVLQPGDLCIMDNFQVVHGRRPFQANFDGSDRWLKRVLVARDLRKSILWRDKQRTRMIT
ncbi:MAG: guanitoxin biosynthesis L-enduracididine beta-hydroxylase GntD [Pirellulaceae bacterium]